MSAVPNLPESVLMAKTIPRTRHKTSEIAQSNGVHPPHAQPLPLSNTPVENCRRIKVIVVGAGYSGIYCGIRIPEKIRNVQLTIYDKNPGVGGTWWENRYPGCACDIPSCSYQYSFEPNPDWSSIYAPAEEIRDYLGRTARKYGADRFIKLSHQVTGCRWDEKSAKWHVQVTDLVNGLASEDTADVLISARGNLNSMAWPSIPGLRTFQGELMHSAKWNEKYDFTGKRIGVIGSGSSAIQIVPQLQKVQEASLTCFIRSPTWISPPFGQQVFDKLAIEGFEDARDSFRSNRAQYDAFRLAVEEDGNSVYAVNLRGSALQLGFRDLLEQQMRSKLSSRPDIAAAILPDFSPGCRRLTPGIGFLEALQEQNVTFVNQSITGVEPTGIRTAEGEFHTLDVLVCATGFHTGAPPPFPVIGRGGVSLQKKWRDRPTTYLSHSVDNFPNHFVMLGPNAAIGAGSLTMMIEATGDYIVKAVRKLQKENIRSMAVKSTRVCDFISYVDKYFAGTVFTEQCRSWYKQNGRIVGLWPGSTLHCLETLRSPRWEDYEYTYGDEEDEQEGNRLAWLGSGECFNQQEGKDLAWYLYPEFLEIPQEGRPEDLPRYRTRPFSH